MALAAAMVGNSSSGIIEAPSFALPVVNVGSRQAGRVRAANVIDVGYERAEIAQAIGRAMTPEFRGSLHGLDNPYGDGRAAERIVTRLKSVALDERLICKAFCDVGTSP
jgi:UDP-N-acetylglucosamine 2-epimerase